MPARVDYLQRLDLDGKVVEHMLEQHKKRKADRGFMLWKLLQLALSIDAQGKFK